MSPAGANLGRYVATLRRQWVVAAAIVAVAAAAAYVVASLKPVSYAATSKVLLDQDRHVDTLLGTTGYAADPERELNTGILLITLEPIAADVRRSLGLEEPAAALAARVSTATDRNSSIVSITASDADPVIAARIANEFAAGYRDYRAETIRRSVDQALASARARRSTLLEASERSELDAQVRRLQAIGAFDTGGVQLVQRARAGAATVSPRPLVSAFVGAFLGLLLAGMTIVVLTRTDPRIRDEHDLEQATGRPVTVLLRDAGAVEAQLLPVAASLHRSTVLVTSAGPDEGAAEVMIALAQAIAVTGASAIAIDADSAGPPAAGVDESLVPLAATDGAGSAWLLDAGSPGLRRMAALVEAAQERADVVLVAGRPEAAALPGLAADVLLVARLDVTRADDLRRTVRALSAADAPLAGVVATTAPGGGPLRGALERLRPESLRRPPKPARHETASEVTVG